MPKARLLPAALHSTGRRWTVDDARVALAALGSSGLSVATFAAREGIDAQRLYFWGRRLGRGAAEPAQAPAFIEIRGTTERERVEILLRSGRVVRAAETIDADVLRRLVDALEQDPTC
jgi:transposase-like protein